MLLTENIEECTYPGMLNFSSQCNILNTNTVNMAKTFERFLYAESNISL